MVVVISQMACASILLAVITAHAYKDTNCKRIVNSSVKVRQQHFKFRVNKSPKLLQDRDLDWFEIMRGRRGGLIVGAPESGSGGSGSSPGRGTALCSCERHFTLIVPLSTLV